MQIQILAFCIGATDGLRSFTAPAVVAWAAHLGWINLNGSPLAFMGSLWAACILTLLALGELVADKLPNMPGRTQPPGVIARLLFGALTGACVAIAGKQGIALGAVLGAIGAMCGMFAGYTFRTRFEKAIKAPDIVLALLEDAVAIGGGLLIVMSF